MPLNRRSTRSNQRAPTRGKLHASGTTINTAANSIQVNIRDLFSECNCVDLVRAVAQQNAFRNFGPCLYSSQANRQSAVQPTIRRLFGNTEQIAVVVRV